MKTSKKEKVVENPYEPRKELVDHLKKRRRLEILYKEIDNAGEAWKKLTDEQKKEEKEKLDKELKNITKMKVDILNKYVFRSMANVVVFLEYCKNPLLREVFDKDIEELLLGISQRYSARYKNETVIARFLTATLAYPYPDTFTLKLFPIIQNIITSRILAIAQKSLGKKMLDSVIVNNFKGAAALAEFIGKDTNKIKLEKPHRPVKF